MVVVPDTDTVFDGHFRGGVEGIRGPVDVSGRQPVRRVNVGIDNGRDAESSGRREHVIEAGTGQTLEVEEAEMRARRGETGRSETCCEDVGPGQKVVGLNAGEPDVRHALHRASKVRIEGLAHGV